MPKGGARARGGPAPDPNALRRERDSGDWVKLPAKGRDGDPPEWPLAGHSTREAELWAAEWARPQALMWERNGQQLEVALYVRRVAQAEEPDATVAVGTLVRQMQEALGISVPGMLRNRWLIVADEVAPRRASRTAKAAAAPSSARNRLKALSGGAS
jgi:hypothetical protein